MPRLIETETDDRIELGDLIEALETGGFDPEDEESIVAFGPALRALSNNRRFLGDLIIEELKQNCSGQRRKNQYTPQVFVLHGSSGKYLIRANFWPAETDSVVVNSGKDPFFYELPHDHNFSFLTVGHHGPGYWSDYYEYDYERTVGYSGEKVDLRFVERSRLDPGKVLLYRRHRDVHRQLPPDALSISLNILALSPASEFRHQYLFDIERSEIVKVGNPSSLESLVLLAGHCGGEEGRALVTDFADHHPSDRIRFAAVRAQAALASSADDRISVYEAAIGSDSPYVREMAAQEARRLEAVRPWLESVPAA
ncbi:transposase [Sphingomonas parva]|uniref:Transposase n=1 Tax=Sphingomonas parva TaxID=2555898 RepID=A0A4Y8ZUT0_9SPHN|nr:transposase [Sphingomonas parva]TFI59227.1 transposase [Sphingomonas parva]